MASKSLGQLTVDLVAKVGGFVDGMDKADRAAARAAKNSEASWEKMSAGAKKHFAAVAKAAVAVGSAAVAGGVAMVTAAANSAKELQNLSQVANANSTEFQRWSVGAKTVGIEQQK